MCHYLTLICKSEKSAGFCWLYSNYATKQQWKSCCWTVALIWPLNMQRSNLAVDPHRGLPFNLLRRQKRPGTKHPFGHEDPWRACKVGRVPIMRPAAFSVVSVRDLSYMLANIDIGCCFLLLLCCLKTSHINESLWLTLNAFMFAKNQEVSNVCNPFSFF